jgi:hypothetical protein
MRAMHSDPIASSTLLSRLCTVQRDGPFQPRTTLSSHKWGTMKPLVFPPRPSIAQWDGEGDQVSCCDSLCVHLAPSSARPYRNGHYEDAVRTYARHFTSEKWTPIRTRNMLEVAATWTASGPHFHLPRPILKGHGLVRWVLTIRRTCPWSRQRDKEIATTLNIGHPLHEGEQDKALELYREALRMRRNLFGNEHLDIAATILQLLRPTTNAVTWLKRWTCRSSWWSLVDALAFTIAT